MCYIRKSKSMEEKGIAKGINRAEIRAHLPFSQKEGVTVYPKVASWTKGSLAQENAHLQEKERRKTNRKKESKE